jgi:hypothetical protein
VPKAEAARPPFRVRYEFSRYTTLSRLDTPAPALSEICCLGGKREGRGRGIGGGRARSAVPRDEGEEEREREREREEKERSDRERGAQRTVT